MKVSSQILAQLIIKSHKKKPLFTSSNEENELFSLIKSNDEEHLAYWLFIHSFLKFELDKIIAKKDFSLNDIPDELLEKINDRMNAFIREQSNKKTISKFSEKDFHANDYLSLNSNIQSVSSRLSFSDLPISQNHIAPIVQAKNRRNEALMRNMNLQLISCKDYAPHSTIRKLAKSIKDIKEGERKQFHYFHLSDSHAVGFDVERDESGHYKIFVFEPTGDANFFETVDLLYKKLKEMKVSFEINAYPGGMQKDHMNCSVFVLSALTELTKYKHTFDYIKSPDHSPNSPETIINNEYKAWTKMDPPDRHIELTNMDKISWVPVSQLPSKIMLLDQSYTSMQTHLNESPDFDLEASKLIEIHKKKYNFDPKNEQSTKYVNQKREKILGHLKQFEADTTAKYKEEIYQQYPLLKEVHNQQLPDFESAITNNNQLNVDDKLNALKDMFIYICKSNNFKTLFSWIDPTKMMTKTEAISLILLRKEYIKLVNLVTQNDRDKIKDFFANPSVGYDMLQAIFECHLCEELKNVIKFEPLTKVLEDNFSMDEITKLIKRLGMICSRKYDLSVENPLRKLLLNEKSITLDQVLDTLEEFRNHYKTGEGSLFTLKDNLELIEAAIKKKIYSKFDKNSKLDINKETVTILKLSYIKTWLDVYKENLRLNPIDWLKNDEQFKNVNAARNYCSPPFTNNLNFLNALNLDINHHPDLNEDKKKIFHQVINEASIALLNHFQDEDYHKITINHLPIAKILFSLLEENQDNTPSKESIINQLNKIESLLFKLRILDITYDKIVNNTNLKSEYTPQQLNIIATLQEVYKELIKNEPFDENNKRFNESLTNAVNNSPLTRFVSSKLNPSTFFGQDARSALTSSLEGLIKGEQRPKAQFGNRESENMDGADQKSPTLREEGSTALKQIYHIHSNYNWIEYDRKNLEIPAKDWGYDNWKLNLSIHKDDLDKAFAIMADIASKYHLGAFKRMSNEQASSPGANMVGRQIAVYYDANPELDSDAWLTIISEIEDELKKQGIRLSTLPISNRRIGQYTSYTHDAWVNDSKIGQVVTFGEGIKETALEDEDPFSKFYYDEYGESIAKKEESSLSPMSC